MIAGRRAGKPVDRRDVYRMVARIASPHSLQHAAITNALDAGVPLRDAQILDRHGVHFLTAYMAGV